MKKILIMAMVMFATMVAADVAAVNTQDTAEPVECEHCKAVRLGLISEEEA